MRAKEFLFETEASILTYLSMCGYNIYESEHISTDILGRYVKGEVLFEDADEALYEINKRLLPIISHPSMWGRFKDDPEWIDVYKRISTLIQKNSNIMNKGK